MGPLCFAPRRYLLAAGLLVVAATTAPADTPYTLTNPSFESPTLSPSSSWYAGVSGWGVSGSPGTTYNVSGLQSAPSTNGTQQCYGALDSFMIFQQTGVIAANTYYEFKIDLFPLNTGTNRASLNFEETDTWTPPMVQKHFHPSWQPSLEDFVLTPGVWNTVTIRFNSSTTPSVVGKNFRFRLEGSHLAVDNARMITSADRDYYISFSSGSDANDGLTSSTPWKTFDNINARVLGAGDRVLLKRGDTWNQELHLSGKGASGNNVQVTAYGSGALPIISRTDLAYDKCLVYESASHVTIDNLDLRNAKLGIFLRYYNNVNNQSVTITDCAFSGMTNPTLDPSLHNYELAWSDAIFLGGKVDGVESETVLDGLTITNCTANQVAHGFGTGWYYPPTPNRSRIRNLIMEDNLATNCQMGWAALIHVDGGHMKRCHSLGSGNVDTWAGSTAGMIQKSQNYLIDDCEFGFTDRKQAGDGCGFDFEGDVHNVTFTNNTIHHNDASALLILSNGGSNSNLTISNNTFYANARDPWNSDINSEIQGSGTAGTGTISNNGMYRLSTNVNFISPTSNWSGYTITGNRQLEYTSVSGVEEPWWNFQSAGYLEGWNSFNQWTGNTVSGGFLNGTSAGVDPYATSSASFVNTTLFPYVWVRMSQTAGTLAQVFYITDADPYWDGAKSVNFAIVPDGAQHDYFVDLDGASHKGVITQVRLDPTTVGGSTMAIDHIRITDSTNPAQSPPPPVAALPYTLTFRSLANEDGFITESAAGSGTGSTVDVTSSTSRLGDDASNRAYRQFLSFDTAAVPDDATIVEATIGMTRTGQTGTIPIGVADSSYGDVLVDVVTGNFSGLSALAAGDYNAAATTSGASKFAWPAYSNGMSIYSRLESADNTLIKKTGRTQYRVRYQNDDDADGVADYMSYATGENPTFASRPTLTIKYTVPATSYWVLLADDFENGYGNYTSGGIDALYNNLAANSQQGNGSMDLQDNSGTASAAMSPVLDLHNPNFTSLKVDFLYKGVSMETGEDFFVEYYNGSVWTIVSAFVSGTNFTNGNWTAASVTINESSYTFPTNAQIRMRCDASDDNDDVYIDALVLSVK